MGHERYLTKKELKYRMPKSGNFNEIWEGILTSRKSTCTTIPLKDQNGNDFWFNITENIRRNIEWIDHEGTKELFRKVPKEMEVSFIVDSIIDEAYNSSVIEGAFSTKKRTKELVAKRNPQNKSEHMIINSHHALEFILDNIDIPLDEEMILSIYKTITKNTLEEDEVVEKYRTGFVGVWDTKKDRYVYNAPDAQKVQGLMNSLLSFIKRDLSIHPLIKACIIHFYFVYVHPFFDGNGRTARSITYMYLLQNGYDFFKFFSISSFIQEERNKYYKAIENVEIYGSDLTYFIDYYLQMIVKSMSNIIEKFEKELGKQIINNTLKEAGIKLGKRQIKIINRYIASRDGKNILTIEEYRKKNKISYETARTDLNELTTLGFFHRSKFGRKYIYKFNNIKNIVERIEASGILEET